MVPRTRNCIVRAKIESSGALFRPWTDKENHTHSRSDRRTTNCGQNFPGAMIKNRGVQKNQVRIRLMHRFDDFVMRSKRGGVVTAFVESRKQGLAARGVCF